MKRINQNSILPALTSVAVFAASVLPTSLSLAQDPTTISAWAESDSAKSSSLDSRNAGQWQESPAEEMQENASAEDVEALRLDSLDGERKFSISAVVSDQTQVDLNTVSAIDDSKKDNIVIYGGWAGNIGDCASRTESTQVCNSCTGTGAPSTVCGGGTNYACAERSVYNDLIINMNVMLSTLPNNATPRVQINKSGSLASVTTETGTVTPTAANQSFTVRVKWSSICQAYDGTSCETATRKTIEMRVGLAEGSAADLASGNYQTFTIKFRGVDPTTATTVSVGAVTGSNNGVIDFTMLPGDEKAYIRDITRDSNTPADTSVSYWKSLKIFATAYSTSTPDFCSMDLTAASTVYATLDFSDKTKDASSDNSLNHEFLDGLVNETSYMFTGASADDTTIVQSFLNPSGLTGTDLLRYTATPGEVIGLLDKQKCFVATAAFGSPMNEHVQNLRNFRDHFLLKNYFGKRFVRFYYQNSTRWARWIEANPEFKPWVRLALWPLVVMAESSLLFGFFSTALFFVLIVGGFVFLIRRYQTKLRIWNEWRNL